MCVWKVVGKKSVKSTRQTRKSVGVVFWSRFLGLIIKGISYRIHCKYEPQQVWWAYLYIYLFIWLIEYLIPTNRISIMSFEIVVWYRILFPANFSWTSFIQYCAIMGYVSHYSAVETYNLLDIGRSGGINSPRYVNQITWEWSFRIFSRSFFTDLRFSPSLSSFLSPKWIRVREKIKELTFCPKWRG